MPAGPHVLIGFAESLAAIETAWLLLDAGFRVSAFTRSGARPALQRDPRVVTHQVVSPQHDVEATLAGLRGLVDRLAPAAVLPLDDDAVWLCDHVWSAGDTGRMPLPALAGPSGARAALALDKVRQLDLARDAGFAVPPTVVLRPGEACGGPGPGPWIVKPALAADVRNGRLRRGSARTVRDAIRIPRLVEAAGETMLVQPLMAGIGEGLFGFAGGAGVAGWSAHRRIRMKHPAGSGSSACASIDVEPALRAPATELLAAASWRGLFMIELLRDRRGTPWWMELNGRTWGSMVLARHRALPYPVWAVHSALDPGFVPSEPAPGPHVVARHLGREIVHAAHVLRGPQGAVVPDGWPRRTEAVRELVTWHRGERVYNFRRGHAGVLVSDTWQTVSALRPLRRVGDRA